MNNGKENVLYVAEHSDVLQRKANCIEFSFTEAATPTGMSAWLQDDGSDYYYFVQSACRCIEASFRVQALNYHVANKLVGDSIDTLCIKGAYGATLDLSRVALMLGVESNFIFDKQDVERLACMESSAQQWVVSCFEAAKNIYLEGPSVSKSFLAGWPEFASKLIVFESTADIKLSPPASKTRTFDYSVYEMVLRDHTLLYAMQKPDANHFSGCSFVLDLGAGSGIFLDVLRSNGISAAGVERNPDLVTYGRQMGLDLVASDAMDYLTKQSDLFDGVYCSHFVEHLPIDAVEQLIAGIAKSLQSQGVAVFTFPDPESIRSQLLGFWRDPEHVRFYHPDLITNIARAQGLQLEWSSYDQAPHDVVPFSVVPPEVQSVQLLESKPNLWQRVLGALGVASYSQICQLQCALRQQVEINNQLVNRTQKLWDVNKTWAWNDNVTLRFRKS